MAANTERTSTGLSQNAKDLISTVMTLGVIAAIIWAIVFSAMSWHHGIYAGMHYNDAKRYAVKQMVAKYGIDKVHSMRLGHPDVVNTHLPGPLGSNGAQERVFHFVDPGGNHYCVSIWKAGGFQYDLQEGCKF